MNPITSRRGQDWIDAMKRAFAEDAAYVEKHSGPDQKYALLRDCCVPVFAMRILGKDAYHHILDVGCGTGSLTRILATVATKVKGIDAVDDAIRIASERGAGFANLEFSVADVFSTPLENEAYDFMHVREFHPLTRDLYADNTEKREAHRQIIAKLAASLTHGGFIYLAHVTGKRQCLNAAELKGLEGLELVCHGVDGRVLFLLAPILRYRKIALRVAKFLSLPLRLNGAYFFEIVVLRKL